MIVVERRGEMKIRNAEETKRVVENKLCAGGVRLFIIDERDLGFGCIEGNRRFLF